MNRINRNAEHERGFTLIEVIIVLGTLSLVTGVVLMAIYQLLIVPANGNARLAIDADFRTANLWLMHDGNESQTFTPGGTCGVFYAGAARNVSYTYSYSAAGRTLNRTDSSTGQTIAVAHHVAAAPSCTVQGQTVVVVFTSSSGGLSQSMTLTVALRVK
jgi:prepilin-type N-terminal cleavage/methylation domain-containing protein